MINLYYDINLIEKKNYINLLVWLILIISNLHKKKYIN